MDLGKYSTSASPAACFLSATDMALHAIRTCLPNIAKLLDEAIKETDTQLLTQLIAGADSLQTSRQLPLLRSPCC